MSSPLNKRYHSERTIKAGGRALAGWSPRDVASLVSRAPVRSHRPTIEEMRRVAQYLADELDLQSAAGKLLARAALLERNRNRS